MEGESMQTFSEDSKKFLQEYLLKKNLSKREVEVVMLVLQGLTNREVANNLCVAEKTVKFHLTNVYKKMKISRRSQIFWTLPLADFIGINEKNHRVADQNDEQSDKTAEVIPVGSSTISDIK